MIKIDTKEEEIYLIDIQIIASIIFILTIIVSIYLSINKRNEILYNYTNNNKSRIQKINRIVILFLLVIYLYCSYRQSKIDEIKGLDLKADYIEIIVSLLSLIGGLLIIYEVFYLNNPNDNIENPTI